MSPGSNTESYPAFAHVGFGLRENPGKNLNQCLFNIATFLKLEDPDLYTGHDFRRTSATLLNNREGDTLTDESHGGWFYASVAEEYVENSLQHKMQIAKRFFTTKTWTLTLREEQRLRVFENKVLRKIFGAKRDEVTRDWRKLHNAELHALYSSPDIIRNIKSRRLRWAGHVARMGESRNAYRG
ncbi:hypothetical protein ANN_09020 [Periplaneta americana]|uniref:Uncharacterized protein n=1 Tax=Periplaneta americana TaxID=6978 RepID=A0ABQ8TMS5_PERAM|nr:hypothetical protein ANN_09020 [Periplaneta americana]